MSVDQLAALVCAWLVSYFVHSTVLLGGVWIATRRLAPRFDWLAELAWRLALGLPVATSLLQLPLFPGRSIDHGLPLEFTPAPLTVSEVPAIVWLGVVGIWIAGASLALVQLAMLQRSLRRSIEGRTPMPRARLEGICGLRADNVPRVSVVEALAVPLALANEICLPAWVVDTMDRDECRAVIAHELAHVRRHDAIWRPLAAVVARLFFFQPLNWLACARLRDLSECLCDEEAIEAMQSALPLASALQSVIVRNAGRSEHFELVPAMDAPRSFTLERVRRILTRSGAQMRVHHRLSIAVAGITGVAAFVIAPRVTLPPTAFERYTINAQDPAGPFTLTMEKGRAVGATVLGRSVTSAQLIQRGRSVRIIDPSRGEFSVELTPQGGIRWPARKRGR